MAHFEDTNERHYMVINTKTLGIWCYLCDDYIQNILNSLEPDEPGRDQLHGFIEKLQNSFISSLVFQLRKRLKVEKE